MYYIKEEEFNYNKYLVCFDEEKLEELRKEIIDNCSLITHYEFEGQMPVSGFFEYSKTRNFNYKQIGDYNSEMYYISYEKIEKMPFLITIIDEILRNRVNILDWIYTDKISYFDNNKENLFTLEILKLCREIENETDDNLRKEKATKLKSLMIHSKYNNNQKSEAEYLPKLLEILNIQFVDSISKAEVEKVQSFYEGTNGINSLKKTFK